MIVLVSRQHLTHVVVACNVIVLNTIASTSR